MIETNEIFKEYLAFESLFKSLRRKEGENVEKHKGIFLLFSQSLKGWTMIRMGDKSVDKIEKQKLFENTPDLPEKRPKCPFSDETGERTSSRMWKERIRGSN